METTHASSFDYSGKIAAARAGVRVEIASTVWMVIEALAAIGAGIAAGSILLTAFGLDSVLELVTGAALLWRLLVETRGGSMARVERAERVATWVAGVGLALLCLYILAVSLAELIARHHAAESVPGLALAAASVAIMPVLARRKRLIAEHMESAALRGDAACSITCAYMAATLLAGLALQALFGWWWADGVAALALLWWLVPETRETLASARSGEVGCGCCDD